MPPDSPDTLPYWILPLGALALAFVAWTGCWRPKRLAEGPPRPSDLQPWDLLVALGLMVMGGAALSLVVRRITGGADPNTLSTPAYAGVVVLGQLLSQGPAVGYFLWRAGHTKDGFRGGFRNVGLRPRRWGGETGLALAALLVALPVVISTMTLAIWIGERFGQPAPELGHQLLKVLRDADSVAGVLLLLGSVILLGPLLEEMIYRGLLHTALLARFGIERRVWVILLAALLFAVMHVGVPWQAMPGLFVLGLVLGWLYERTGSLWPCVVAHAGFNAFNSGLVLLTTGG